jgi:putative membrane protein
MGFADSIPAISGGTVLYISGKYERVMCQAENFVHNRLPKILKTVANLNIPQRQLFKPAYSLATLSVGVLVGLGLMTLLIDYLISSYSKILYSFILGVIVLSVPIILARDKKDMTPTTYGLVFIGFLISLSIQLLSLSLGNSKLTMLVSGALVSTAMLLPGISGSLLLLLLNKYEYTIGIISSMLSSPASSISELVVFGYFLVGGLIGGIISVKAIAKVAQDSRTVYFFCGIIGGSIHTPISKIYTGGETTILLALPFLCGNAVMMLFYFFSEVSNDSGLILYHSN